MKPIQEINNDWGDEQSSGLDVLDNTNSTVAQRRSTKVIQQRSSRKILLVTVLVLALGAGVSAVFLYTGISGALEDQQETFERRASDFSKEIEGAWADYEGAARWVHSECRNWRTDNFTHTDFEAVYNYLTSKGLDFFSINWIPNITHAEREQVEQQEGYAYWKQKVPGAENYVGFTGQEPDPNNPSELVFANRTEQPFYYPIYFVEPKSAASSIIHYDLYSPPWERPAILQAISTMQPALTARFVLAQHTPEDGYSTLLYHPGVALPSHLPTADRQDFAVLVLVLNPFLQRAARFQREALAVYLYDVTASEIAPEFLGGVQVIHQDGDYHRRQVLNTNETEYDSLLDSQLYFERRIDFGGRTWAICVVPVENDKSFDADFSFAILSGVLLFAASVLLALIWYKHNKQHTKKLIDVVDKAEAEARIVSSLYPTAVREEMIKQQQEKEKEAANDQSGKEDFFVKTGTDFNLFDNDESDMSPDGSLYSRGANGIYKTKPIAHRHEATTIMFADLAGFTAWSSQRTPEDVFTLLETLYGAFDAIAKRRRVFKVETIGDCYVAVCGLPKPREDHAVVMCRFATDCLHKMQKLTKILAETLGEDTANLGFRVGLHSGAVTAGVLRGDKGRFQLFGDTMNTASRMESNGVKNKIQVSPETAEELTQRGYQNWLAPREEKIQAKGKGEIQTYFVTISAASTISGATAESSLSDQHAEHELLSRSSTQNHSETLEQPSMEASQSGSGGLRRDGTVSEKP